MHNFFTVSDDWSYYHLDFHRFHGPQTDTTNQPRTVDVDEVQRNLETQRRENATNQTSQKRQLVDQLTVSLVAWPVFWWHDRRFAF